MKPDGVTMETTEPAAEANPSLSQVPRQDSPPSEPQEAAGHEAPCKTAQDPEVKPKAVSKKQPNVENAGSSTSNPQPGAAPASPMNDAKSSHNRFSKIGVALPIKTSTTKAAVVGAVLKRPAGGAVASVTVKNQARGPGKISGPARPTSAATATVTNGRKAPTASRRPAAETVNETKPKAAASRSALTNAPKPSTSAASKTDGSSLSKTTRLVASRPASAMTRPTKAPTKPSASVLAKTASPRATTTPSSVRTATVQPSKPTAVKKDVCQPLSATVSKKPATSAAPKKYEASKAPGTTKLTSATKKPISTQVADPKQSKTQDPLKLTKKAAVTTAQVRAVSKQPLCRPPLGLPVNKPTVSNSQAKKGLKTTQPTVPPSTAIKKTDVLVHSGPVKVQSSKRTPAAAAPAKVAKEVAVVLPQPSNFAASAQEASSKGFGEETPQDNGAAWSPHSPERTTIPPISPNHDQKDATPPLEMQDRNWAPVEVQLPEMASHTEPSDPVYQLTDCTPATSTSFPTPAAQQTIPSVNLNEEEDEEEKEGSQLVSVSEMSGATQPTEESRPGSAGPLGGCAWRAGGALLSELDSEEVSGSQQGASELSAPGVLEGTESTDDLGDGSLKGAMDIEGASAGSPDFEKVPDIPVNDFEEEDDDEDDYDRVCDMDVGSEQAEDPQRPKHDNDVDDEEDEDVEMASEGVTESGLESYGNADEDDFVEDERLDNLNRLAQLPPPHLLPSAPGAQWNHQNPLVDPWAQPQHVLEVAGAVVSPFTDHWQADSETPTQSQAQSLLELGSISCLPENREVPHHPSAKHEASHMYVDQPSLSLMQNLAPAPLSAPGTSLSSTVSSGTSTPEELCDYNQQKRQSPTQVGAVSMQNQQPEVEHKDLNNYLDDEEEAEAETLPADEILGEPTTASSSSITEDEVSDAEGEVQLVGDSPDKSEICHTTFEVQPPGHRCLSTVEEGEEAESDAVEGGAGEDFTLPSATSVTSGFDVMTSASTSNGQSTGDSCTKSPGVFSLEELSDEAKEPCAVQQVHTQPTTEVQHYAEYRYQEAELTESDEEQDPEKAVNPPTESSLEHPDEIQSPCFKVVCEQTDDSFAGFTALPYLHSREHSTYVRTYCDIVKPHNTTAADLSPRSHRQQAQSPQLRRLEQHQRQLQELQQRREQQSKPLEEVEQERKRREEEELRKKKDEAEEEIKRNEREDQGNVMESKGKELEQRRELELQLQQQQQELQQRQQIMQWQQELQQVKGQTVLLSPSSGLCTIYEALENSDDEVAGEVQQAKELNPIRKMECSRMNDKYQDSSTETNSCPQQSSEERDASCCTPDSSARPPPLDLDWGDKVDIVQQLINQTLLLNGDGCSSVLLLPGGGGGTLSPLESSLWPNLLPPLTPPSATVTSVSSFSPEASGSSPQGEWTVVELETHH